MGRKCWEVTEAGAGPAGERHAGGRQLGFGEPQVLTWGRKIQQDPPCPHAGLSAPRQVQDPLTAPSWGTCWPLLGCRSGDRELWPLVSE